MGSRLRAVTSGNGYLGDGLTQLWHPLPDEARGFLRGITWEPDDPKPRRVFADWLDDRSDPCGKLMRWSCKKRLTGRTDRDWSLLQPAIALNGSVGSWYWVTGKSGWRPFCFDLSGWLFRCLECGYVKDGDPGQLQYWTDEVAWFDLMGAWRRSPPWRRNRIKV